MDKRSFLWGACLPARPARPPLVFFCTNSEQVAQDRMIGFQVPETQIPEIIMNFVCHSKETRNFHFYYILLCRHT